MNPLLQLLMMRQQQSGGRGLSGMMGANPSQPAMMPGLWGIAQRAGMSKPTTAGSATAAEQSGNQGMGMGYTLFGNKAKAFDSTNGMSPWQRVGTALGGK